MIGFHYVSILESRADAAAFYVGRTDDLVSRLANHNGGGVPHTAKQRPWEFKTVLAFRSLEKAIAFERYLKSGSGRAFAKKRL